MDSQSNQNRKRRESNEDEQDNGWSLIPKNIKVDLRHAAIGGALAFVAALAGGWLVGEASGAEARHLLDTSLTSTRSFCGTVTLAASTILALMLTLLSISAGSDVQLKGSHYQRIRQIALIDTTLLISAVLAYLLLNVPLQESDSAPGGRTTGFAVMYYATLALASLLGGGLISVVVMIYKTVSDFTRTLGPGESSPLSRSGEKASG